MSLQEAIDNKIKTKHVLMEFLPPMITGLEELVDYMDKHASEGYEVDEERMVIALDLLKKVME